MATDPKKNDEVKEEDLENVAGGCLQAQKPFGENAEPKKDSTGPED